MLSFSKSLRRPIHKCAHAMCVASSLFHLDATIDGMNDFHSVIDRSSPDQRKRATPCISFFFQGVSSLIKNRPYLPTASSHSHSDKRNYGNLKEKKNSCRCPKKKTPLLLVLKDSQQIRLRLLFPSHTTGVHTTDVHLGP